MNNDSEKKSDEKWIDDHGDDFIPFIEIEGLENNKSSIAENDGVLNGSLIYKRTNGEMDKGTVQKTEQSLRLLIQATKEKKEQLAQDVFVQNTMGFKRVLNELATVKFKGARRIGHTTSVLKIALEEFPEGDILYITHGLDNTKRVERNLYTDYPELRDSLQRIHFSHYMCLMSLANSRGSQPTYSCIICDLPFMMDKKSKDVIESKCIKSLEKNPNFLLVKVG